MAAVVGLSVAVHAAVLLGPLAVPVLRSAPPPAFATATPVTVRMVDAEPLPAAQPVVEAGAPMPPPPALSAAPAVTVDGAPSLAAGARTAADVDTVRAAPGSGEVRPTGAPTAPSALPAMPAQTLGAATPVATPATPSTPAPPAPPARRAAADAALPPAPDFHHASALDPGPKPLGDIDLVFPPEAGLHDGLVALRLLVDEAGSLVQVAVLRSQPKGMFDAAAVAAFSSARFSPGRLAGVPVKSQLTVEVEFKPFNRGADVSGRGY